MHAITAETCPVNKSHSCGLGTKSLIVSWLCRLGVAGILGQTLFFKLTYAPETQLIFGPLGGRPAATAVALMELVAVVLLLIPRTVAYGALLALATIGGAILSHLTWLGFEIVDPSTGQGDGGLLFILALIVAGGSSVLLWLHRRTLLQWIKR
jgi:uncharacterized membrane protein YphA (DoxX/SURF4 family)